MSSVTHPIEIKPGEGFGKLRFGASMDDVEKSLGKAEDIEKLEEVEDYKNIIWHYWSRGYSLFFDVMRKQTFTCVEIDNHDAILWGEKIFEMNEKEIIVLFKSKGYSQLDTEKHEWGEKRLSFDDALIDFYFEDGILVSVNYGVFGEDKKIIIFPN